MGDLVNLFTGEVMEEGEEVDSKVLDELTFENGCYQLKGRSVLGNIGDYYLETRTLIIPRSDPNEGVHIGVLVSWMKDIPEGSTAFDPKFSYEGPLQEGAIVTNRHLTVPKPGDLCLIYTIQFYKILDSNLK